MIKHCTKSEYIQYRCFTYDLAMDRKKSGYPIYSDGIKTKQDFFERSQLAFTRNNEEILLFVYNAHVEGWIHYYWLTPDKYLSTVSFNVAEHTESALSEFIEYVQTRFKGFDLYLSFSNDNQKACHHLIELGFECIEQAYYNIAFLNKTKLPRSPSEKIIEIHYDNYELFRTLHDSQNCDMYWNAERILATLDKWVVLAKIKNQRPIGAIYFQKDDKFSEIFGIDLIDGYDDLTVIETELLNRAIESAKKLGIQYLAYFCNENEQRIVNDCGFNLIDRYSCYKRLI